MQKELVIVDTEAAHLAQILQDSGLKVHAACTLEEAVDILNAVKPLIVSIEDGIPARNGNLYGAMLAQACQLVFDNVRIIGLCNEFKTDFYRCCDAIITKKGDYHSEYKKIIMEFSHAAGKPVS